MCVGEFLSLWVSMCICGFDQHWPLKCACTFPLSLGMCLWTCLCLQLCKCVAVELVVSLRGDDSSFFILLLSLTNLELPPFAMSGSQRRRQPVGGWEVEHARTYKLQLRAGKVQPGMWKIQIPAWAVGSSDSVLTLESRAKDSKPTRHHGLELAKKPPLSPISVLLGMGCVYP